jgi:ankyrin repeat protein
MANITKNKKMVEYVRQNDLMLVETVIHNGANANYKHGAALRLACSLKHWVVAKLLIDKGADYNYCENGYSAVDVANLNKLEEVLQHIKNKERLSKLNRIENEY